MATGYRYPGTRPFSTEDENIFYGRTHDVERLYQLLNLKSMLIFYSASGMGKSSLMRAGLIPKLGNKSSENIESDEKTYLPVIIRFGAGDYFEQGDDEQQRKTLLSIILTELTKQAILLKEQSLPFTSDAEKSSSLWCLVKLFERNRVNLLLIIDQAEELFTYPADQVNQLKEELYLLFNRNIPAFLHKKIQLQLGAMRKGTTTISESTATIPSNPDQQEQTIEAINKDIEFIYSPLKSKILFAVREDKLGLFNVFNDYFPDVLKDTYKLLPLSRQNAIEAITGPAEIEGNFISKPFNYSNKALEKLLNNIREDNETYDPFSIQLNCSYIELNCVIEERKKTIEEADIPEEGKIVKEYYENVWKSVPGDEAEKANYKKEIEEKLIDSKQETRKYVYEKDLSNISGILETLLEKGLIRRDQRGEDHYIELSHDRLVRPLIESARQRIAEENLKKEYEQELKKAQEEKEKADRKRRMGILMGLTIVGILVVVIIWGLINQNKKEKEEIKRDKEFEMYQAYLSVYKANPTLAYNIAMVGNQQKFTRLNKLAETADTQKLGYITTAFVVPGNILGVYLSLKKNQIIVTGGSEIKYFNKNGLIDSTKSFNGDIIYSNYSDGKGYLILHKVSDISTQKMKQYFELKTFEGETRFEFGYEGLPASLKVSNDGKYLIVDNNIMYDVGRNTSQYSQLMPFNINTTSFGNNDSVVKGLLDGQVVYGAKTYNTNSPIASVDIVNDSVIIARSNDNSITFINSTSFGLTEGNSFRGNTMRLLRRVGGETAGSINAIGVSHTGGKVVFGGDDRQARIFSSTGTHLATLNGHTGKIISANFSEDGEETITASSNGEVFVWKVGNPTLLYKNGEMRKLSFLDYKIFKLPNNNAHIEKDNLNNRLRSLVNDNVSFIRQFYSDNEGEEYDSSNTFKLMNEFETIIHPPYVNQLSVPQKRLLFDNYTKIVIIQLERTDTTNFKLFNTLLDRKDSLGISSILLDTLDFQKALQYNDLFDYYIAGLVKKDYEMVMKYSYKKIDLLNSFYVKYPSNQRLKYALVTSYNNAAYYSCFVNRYDEAIGNSLKGLKIDSTDYWLNTNLALGYLLRRNFDEAIKIYNKYKHKPRFNGPGYLSRDFLADLDEMEEAKIIKKEDPTLYQQVQYIRANILNK